MSTRMPFDQRLVDWLEEGPTDAPDQVLETILAALPSIPQRRAAQRVPWRLSSMNGYTRLVAGIAAVAAIFLGVLVLRPGSSPSAVGTTPSAPAITPAPSAPSASPTPAGSPTAPSTAGWAPFTSAWYGFSAAYPPGYTPKRATLHWNLVRDQTVFHDAIDSFTAPSGSLALEGYGTRLPAGTTSDAFLAEYIAPNLSSNCYEHPDQWESVTVDGHPARIARSGCSAAFHAAEAIVVVGDRIWWFGMQGPDEALLRAYLTTIRLQPDAAVDESVKASPKP